MLDKVEFVSYLRSLDVRLTVDAEGCLSCTAPKGVITPQLKSELQARKPEILEFLVAADRPASVPPLDRAIGTTQFEPSSGQKRMWFLQRFDSQNTAYNIGGGLRFVGRLDRDSLARSLREIVGRHEALRTGFVEVGGRPTAVIQDSGDWQMEVRSLLDTPEEMKASELSKMALAEAQRPFDLTSSPLIRACLVAIGPEEHALLVVIHHIAADGWSLGVLTAELAKLYDAYSKGLPSPLPELAVQYSDYVDWYRRHVETRAIQTEVPYWKRQLRGPLPITELPTDRRRPAAMTFRGARLRQTLPREMVASLRLFTRAGNITQFVALMTAFKVLLFRYTGQPDVIVGSASAGRSRSELEQVVGLLMNNLALRTDLSGDPTIRELLDRVRETALSAFSHEHVSLDYLTEIVRPNRDLNRSPIFQVMFILQSFPQRALELPGLHISPIEFDAGISRFDLTVEAVENDGELLLTYEYNTDLFDAATIERVQQHYRLLLEAMLANPDGRISELPMLTAAERRQLAAEGEATRMEYPRDLCVHEWIERQTGETPDAIAVVCGLERLTYRELNVRANRLAHRLRALGVGRESLVGVCLDRSVDLLVAPLAVWKAGGAYVPLDSEYPRQRLAFMLQDSAATVLLTQSHLLDSIPHDVPSVICLDRDRPQWEGESPQAPTACATPDNLAYVIYTSGSTGKPKGVEIAQRSLVNFLASMQRQPGIASTDRLLAVTTFSFDIAGLELYLPLVSGARVVIAPRGAVLDGMALGRMLSDSGITMMQATPVIWRVLLDSGWQGTTGLKILCGGETLPRELAERLLATGAEVWNLYGPTETTIWSTLQRIDSQAGRVPIGRPIANTEVYLMDANGQAVPPGVAGELYIGGDGLARGYLKRPELTAARFVDHPFQAGERLYRTGDLARRMADGSLECIARMDHQVKLRGFRIEPGEIETVLEQRPGIRQAVVVVREEESGDARLVAYVTAQNRESAEPGVLRKALLALLPEYMVPAAFVYLEEFPLTANKKVDRKALPAPDRTAAGPSVQAPPRTATEREVAAIWQDLLQGPRLGIHDNFFDLGGHSLLVVQLQSRLRRQFQREISLVELFQHPTVAAIAGLLNIASAVARGPAQMVATDTLGKLHEA